MNIPPRESKAQKVIYNYVCTVGACMYSLAAVRQRKGKIEAIQEFFQPQPPQLRT